MIHDLLIMDFRLLEHLNAKIWLAYGEWKYNTFVENLSLPLERFR